MSTSVSSSSAASSSTLILSGSSTGSSASTTSSCDEYSDLLSHEQEMGALHHHHHSALDSLNSANANSISGETTTVIGLRQPNRLFGVDNIGASVAAAIVMANQASSPTSPPPLPMKIGQKNNQQQQQQMISVPQQQPQNRKFLMANGSCSNGGLTSSSSSSSSGGTATTDWIELSSSLSKDVSSKRDLVSSSMSSSKNIGCFQATRRKVTAVADHHNGIIAVSRDLGCDGGGGSGKVDEFVTPLLPPCGGGKESTMSISSSLQERNITKSATAQSQDSPSATVASSPSIAAAVAVSLAAAAAASESSPSRTASSTKGRAPQPPSAFVNSISHLANNNSSPVIIKQPLSTSNRRSTSVSRGLQVETEDLIQFSMSCSNNNPGRMGNNASQTGNIEAAAGESNNNFKRDAAKARPEILGEGPGTAADTDPLGDFYDDISSDLEEAGAVSSSVGRTADEQMDYLESLEPCPCYAKCCIDSIVTLFCVTLLG